MLNCFQGEDLKLEKFLRGKLDRGRRREKETKGAWFENEEGEEAFRRESYCKGSLNEVSKYWKNVLT